MGRTNKTLQGAFTQIAGNEWERSAVDQFINRNDAGSPEPGIYSLANPEGDAALIKLSLASFINQYKHESAKHVTTIQELAQLEVIIMQIKARIDMKDVTVYFNKNKYIYARCPFYRNDKDVKEMRVIIDPIRKYFDNGPTPDNLKSLENNPEFMEMVINKLGTAMDEEIERSMKTYDILKNNLEYSN